ncbi:MAG: tRNA lysidine(34) synthetase TilS [Eubacteriales bacterium]|nr:tRNA lysidine(34) synthetase TilS [Eubacteriales bacterium]
MYEKVKRYIKEYSMIRSGDVVIAGVSGGADSICMLDILNCFCKEENAVLAAVHVNHGIRGKEADHDQHYVEIFCEKNHIRCFSYRYDVPELAKKQKLGEEETGRIVRRKAFEETAISYPGMQIKIAIAHNENDQAETVLHHLARGSGLRGLGAIRPVTEKKQFIYIRPLLCVQRSEIEAYLKLKKIEYCTDSTNLENEYTRNRIRNSILPAMQEQVNAQAISHIAQAAESLRQADDFFSQRAKEYAKQCKIKGKDGYLLRPELLETMWQIEKNYLVMEILGELAGKKKDITSGHVQSVLDLFEGTTGRKVSLPYHMTACRNYEGVALSRKKEKKDASGDRPIISWNLEIPGNLKCAAGTFECKKIQYTGQEIPRNQYTKWLDCDKINDTLKARFRQTGDYIFIEPNNTKKKISRIMIDDKIPAEDRGRIPLIALDREIIWMVGGRISEKYKVSSTTKNVLQISYTGESENERKY